ncbi:HlyD family secretion protein [candidate division KSB1 bacterium]
MKFSKFFMLSVVLLLFFCTGNNNDFVLEGTGTIEAVHVDISSPVAGKVANIFVEEGEKVLPGDVLLKIDDSDFKIQRKLVKAQFDAASAKLKLILAGAREEDIQRAQENVKGAKAAFEKAESNFNRLKNLYEKGSATKSLLENATAGFEVAQANYQASKKVLEKLVKGARLEEIEMAQANRSMAEANLELVEKRISDCSITSPVKGSVTNKLVETGERVLPNGLLLTVTKTDSMWITVYISDRNIGRVKTGQEAEIKIDTYEDRVFRGNVKFIAEEAEFTPKNIQTKDEREKLVFGVKIKIYNSEGLLKSGLPADVILKLQ